MSGSNGGRQLTTNTGPQPGSTAPEATAHGARPSFLQRTADHGPQPGSYGARGNRSRCTPKFSATDRGPRAPARFYGARGNRSRCTPKFSATDRGPRAPARFYGARGNRSRCTPKFSATDRGPRAPARFYGRPRQPLTVLAQVFCNGQLTTDHGHRAIARQKRLQDFHGLRRRRHQVPDRLSHRPSSRLPLNGLDRQFA